MGDSGPSLCCDGLQKTAITIPHRSAKLTLSQSTCGFSESFTKSIQPKKAMRQIGNAVPPLLAEAIAKHILNIEENPDIVGLHKPVSENLDSGKQNSLAFL